VSARTGRGASCLGGGAGLLQATRLKSKDSEKSESADDVRT
jgi:hypothetical protein